MLTHESLLLFLHCLLHEIFNTCLASLSISAAILLCPIYEIHGFIPDIS
jgi:hypothetical protein